MKKSLIALAVLGVFAGAASAQSSVTLFGTIDVNARDIKNTGSAKRLSESTDGINSSQVVFSGIEDLGSGLKASFVLNAGVNPDTGTANSKFFGRRSTVSLSGGFGEIRLGRDYTPTFGVVTSYDVFGTNGIGDYGSVKQLGAIDYVRADNSIAYFLPSNIGGVYGQVMVSAAEGGAAGRYVGGRLGFAAGPVDVAAAYSQERVTAAGFGNNFGLASTGGKQYKTANVGGSYNFGVVKIMGFFNQEKINTVRDRIYSLGASIPVGQGEVHVGGEQSRARLDGSPTNKSSKLALGYVYNLSKRTAIYGTAARMNNGDHAVANSVAGSYATSVGIAGGSAPGSQTAFPTVGGHSSGAEVGIRHFF